MTDVSLTAAQRSSLLALQRTASAADDANRNITTGRRVNEVNDDPVAFFIARQLTERGAEFTAARENIDQGISATRVSIEALDTIEDFTDQLRGLAEAARSTDDPGQLTQLQQQFETIGRQISEVARDASFGGQNLLSSDNNDLTINVGANDSAQLTIESNNLVAETAGSGTLFDADAFTAEGDIRLEELGVTGGDFTSFLTNPSEIDALIGNLTEGVDRARAQAQNFGSTIAVLQERAEFDEAAANELQAGADALTLADLNEEVALSVAAQTRSQLGTQALSISGGQQRALLSLIEGSV